jgi:hypothetical protein
MAYQGVEGKVQFEAPGAMRVKGIKGGCPGPSRWSQDCPSLNFFSVATSEPFDWVSHKEILKIRWLSSGVVKLHRWHGVSVRW